MTEEMNPFRGLTASTEFVDETTHISPYVWSSLRMVAEDNLSRIREMQLSPDELHASINESLNTLRFVMDGSIAERISESTPSDLDNDPEEEITDDDIENSHYKVFLGDSEDDFGINYELDRFKDKLFMFVPIVITAKFGVAPLVRAWADFNDYALFQANGLSHVSKFLDDLDNRQKIIIAVYVFGKLSHEERRWVETQYETKHIEWIKVSPSGVKHRKT